jgi:uncharacterized membrane protein YkvI
VPGRGNAGKDQRRNAVGARDRTFTAVTSVRSRLGTPLVRCQEGRNSRAQPRTMVRQMWDVNALRNANATMVVLSILIGLAAAMQAGSDAGALADLALGIVLGALCFLSWRGLRSQDHGKAVPLARLANVVIVCGSGFLVFFLVTASVRGALDGSIGNFVGPLVGCVIPAVYLGVAISSLKALRPRGAGQKQPAC